MVALLLSCSVVAKEKKSLEDDILAAIDRVAIERGIQKEVVMEKARSLFNDGQCWPVKGGVAVIRDEIYVLARSKNGVIVGDETIYGADWKKPELFVFAGKKLAGRLSIPSGDEGDVVLALFTPKKVRFFDWKRLEGGFYSRSPE
ncbi:hypothetical protein M2103_001435 [Ereboglobus sp. PH5-5]|uniref:hypothetical protein n=1 Tax=Ereboglobus sp. PH5-5 TaxID=2940529 RepID=UPI0024058D3A|nr:hypothetical protein [Ereboglobus sp. PH5-5]MDF9833212.1 hypothetical protein [Ereboglobus sp. PH5-5]